MAARRKKALAALTPGEKDYAAKNAEAQAAAEKADRALAARREELERMTEALKNEIGRTDKARRLAAVAHLAEFAKMQAAQAKERVDAWTALVPAICNDAAMMDASRETVAAIARKAEAKARAASAARSKAGGAAADADGAAAATAAGGMGVGTVDASTMPVFGEEAPIPMAADL